MSGSPRTQGAVARFALLVAAGIGAAAVIAAFALVARAPAADPPGYRVRVAERLSSGNAGAYPDLGLVALLDDGIGNSVRTGELSFAIDRRQLDPGAMSDLLAAPDGTLIGWVATDATGGSRVQLPLRLRGGSTDGGEALSAEAEVQPQLVPIAGAAVPVTLHFGPGTLVVTVNVQAVAGRYHETTGKEFSFKFGAVYLFGSYSTPGGVRHLARNPAMPTKLTLGASARPCADDGCANLGPAAHDATPVALPEAVTIHPPRRALYGQTTTFTGKAAPGDAIQLAAVRAPGGKPLCGGDDPLCAPAFSPAYDLTGDTARTGRDGRWTLRAALRSHLDEPAYPATDRYAAVTFRGVPLKRLLLQASPGGRFSIFAQAGARTAVGLAKPHVSAHRVGSKLRVLVSVRGGDGLVKIRLSFRGKLITQRPLSQRGRLAMAIPGLSGAGTLRADASAFGARPSSAAVEVG
jgi:hypothetical protein